MSAPATVFPVPESPQDLPLFRSLPPSECAAILTRNNVGRIAFALHDRVNIVPIHYVYVDGWIYGRTASAGKLRDIMRNRRIAFEVDEHADMFQWRSVIVHGPLYLIQPDITERARSIYRTALSAIRGLIPAALTDADPVPFRDQLFRIRTAEISGRASLPVKGRLLFSSKADAIAETAEPDLDGQARDKAQEAIAALGMPETLDVHIEAFDGVMVLSGRVETSRDRHTIESAVLRVPEVTALVQELETIAPTHQDPFPAELARAALKQLRSAPSVLTPGLKLVVEHGWLRLEGVASSQRVRDEAVRRIRGVKGARGVIDRLIVVELSTVKVVAD